ncbi:hypothetical protein U9M48_010584 [Paspalum notatum var. saurae]|uniref:Uncharacterized protein n=1 Tax=Paspalum notatum var. saurae TaxID=547442 RepID=A0AAQ3STG2_PASNO
MTQLSPLKYTRCGKAHPFSKVKVRESLRRKGRQLTYAAPIWVFLIVELHMPVDSYWAHVGSALDKRLPSPFARAINCRLQISSIDGKLTKSLGCPAPVCGEKLSRPANNSTPTCVARTRSLQGEVLRHLNSLIGSPSKTYTDLERGSSICWVLIECIHNSCLAAIGNLHVSPCSVVCAPTIDHMTSFFAHVHPSCHPGPARLKVKEIQLVEWACYLRHIHQESTA